MVDTAALQTFLNQYSWAYDAPDLELMSSQFADDAVMTLRIAGGDLITFDGHGAILDLMRNTLAGQTDQRRHINSNFVYLGEEDGLHRTRSYLTLLATQNGEINLLSAGVYSFGIREEGGVLSIASVHLELDKAY